MFSAKRKEHSTKLSIIKIIIFIVVLFSSLLTTYYLLLNSISAEPNCDSPGVGDVDFCLARIEQEINALKPAQEYNKKELSDLRTQITSLEKRIAGLSNQLEITQKDIEKREEDLAYAEEIFVEKTKNHYKFLRIYDPLLPFLSSEDASEAFREIAFRQKAAKEDIKTMEKYGEDLLVLKNDKETLEKNKVSLSTLRLQVSQRAQFLAGEVEKTEKYLATLSAKQEELIALKAGGFQTSVGDTPPTLEPCSGPPGSSNYCDPGFRPAFAAFSFGAPHRTGMSQYGAFGRAKSGQSAEVILSAYYQGAELNKAYPVPATIGVSGYGRVSFEDNYLLGIYEVPERWGNEGGFEALKAQAVAARSYALAVTNNGAGTICTTEACQVYKPQLKSGKWAEAVYATRGWVMTKGGAPATTYYASTSGGFTISQWGWSGIKDAKDGDWPGQAYEKIASSPWFYKAWYRTRAGSTCGRSNPWLKSEELADILNAWQILYKGGGDVSRISPVDTNCWNGNPYSLSELASIGGYNSVSSVSVTYSNSGSTQSLNFATNKGSVSMSGEEFKKAFNLRAPGYIGLKSSLFNIEKL
ncbi:MAG: SpoIID/LytB domain protein [Candidatus Woesebacteria bacterium GW2011_GWB1_39_10b]|uniref:SpoIID/LytB domain protein n=1 Tax=Candidatus Woesebacteria bacterium GW2011_GWB1_39_10b TaxID=1618573 RepID=A0A0G0P6A6_9BACT|nr:MAG: SpoIID/LytB domain protein [Microgenomates group bacterium GW2011_GWC1_38_12]KKQ93629.1 MAG: SpoIID/LytB domain protein [Candidatus Woesebacteria bacterium GW2011_GWB1_39_10b]